LGGKARKLIESIETIRSMNVVVSATRGGGPLEVLVRRVANPEEEAAVLLGHLGLHLPTRFNIAENVAEQIS